MKGYPGVTCGFGLVCLLAIAAGTASGVSEPRRAAFNVTLRATVTKDWNTVVETTQNGCPVSRRAMGRRTVTLRSARPTRIIVTFGRNRVSYYPAIVRNISGRITQTGSLTTRIMAPCQARTARATCARLQRSVRGRMFRFFRSAHNEISFHAARLTEFAKSCPTESAKVRAIRPGLQDADGEIAEMSLADSRIRAQRSFSGSEVTTDLEGDEAGRVVGRVHWALTFTRSGH